MTERTADRLQTEAGNGRWKGFYTYRYRRSDSSDRIRHPMKMVLTLADGNVRGEGTDPEIGAFEIEGIYLPGVNEIEFVKTYSGRHSIRYTGFYEQGYGIWGTWQNAGYRMAEPGGDFRIWKP